MDQAAPGAVEDVYVRTDVEVERVELDGCQADWEHSVPHLPTRRVDPRISLQWRWTSRRGRPFVGASYRAPLTYSTKR